MGERLLTDDLEEEREALVYDYLEACNMPDERKQAEAWKRVAEFDKKHLEVPNESMD